MIKLTRLNGSRFVLNAELIEIVEETPDTVISLSTGRKYVVSEPADKVIEETIKYKRSILTNLTDENTK